MRTKHFYLCLLLLVLGTANVWADKYYQPWDYRYEDPRFSSLSAMVGEKFMIYNASFNGEEDRTGFLYDNGTKVALDKTKERDRFVYNEKFVYILEDYGTADDGAYAIKSIHEGTYIAANGSTGHATPQPIYIKDWETANTDGWARSGVRCESQNFEGVNNGNITNANCKVFLISSSATHVADEKNYWNGEYNNFTLWTDGHPFAFYKVREVQNGAYLEDLHIFSRSDIYSAQVIWGYVKTAGDITGAAETSLLIDGDLATGVTATDYLQFDLGKAASSIYLFLQRSSADGAVIPANVKVQASANGTDGWQDIETLATGLGSKISFTSGIINLGGSYQYIRVVNAAAGTQLALSEVYILPTDKKVQDAVGYFSELAKADNLVYTRASAQQYTSLVEEYNTKYPEAKTLSGVPLPGNKYRIYADAYDITNHRYVNKDIYWTGKDGEGNNILTMSVADQGSYFDTTAGSDARKAYEWYCEKTSDGYLVFRNVANAGLYLANNGTVSDTPYKWSFSTVQTHHFGVPMWDGQGKYLTVANDGIDGNSGWVPDVSAAQDQTNSANYAYQTAGANTPDDTTDDEYTDVEKGVCTDFVFIPVDVTAAEKKITFTANEIAERNSVFKVDGVVYSLPYSRMFTSEAELSKVTFTLQCPDIHDYSGVYVNGTLKEGVASPVTNTDGVLTFDYSKINDADVLDIKLTFEPFETCNDGSRLYLIRSIKTQSIAQQAPGMRKADSDIGIGGDDGGGPIQTAGANVYYAKFEGRYKRMSLTPASIDAAATTFDATSLFYFQPTEDTETEEYYSVSIRSAITPFMCATTNKWTESGDTWYVQPNEASGMVGYTIGLNVLNATNNPGDAWCTSHNDGDSIVPYNAENDGAAWYFEEVDDAEAKTMLKTYIETTGAAVETTITNKKNTPGIDNDKADKYITYVQGIVENSKDDAITVAELVDLSQKVHMLDHEVEYALRQLPDVTHKEDIGSASNFDYPHWYYIYNVRSKYAADGTTEQAEYYAKFVDKNEHMALEQITDANSDGRKDFGLANMFYFEGKKVTETIGEGTYNKIEDNALTLDEYLQVDVHNFLVPDTTLVSKNKVVHTDSDFHPGGDGWKGEATIVEGLNLQYSDTWRIECEYDFSGDKFESFNTYGSCLLSSTEPGLTWYMSEFQVYLQDDREIVIKLNDGYDTHKWDGTVDYYTNIRIVITHSPAATTFDIYNSKGDKWTVSYTKASLNTVTKLKTMLPGNGVKIKILAIEEVKAHNWKVQDLSAGDPTTVDTANEEDTWYVLPSSNTKYQGFSIVAKGANDDNLGWTNVTASNNEIFSDAGNADNSTWQFVRIEEFDDLVDELLEKYDASDCVIYNEELAALFRLIKKNASYIKKASVGSPINGKTDEDYFNEIYEVIKNYDGPMPDELKKPKPGKFYTVRPAYGNSDMRLVANEYNNVVQRNLPGEVVDGNTHRDSRTVWFFDGDVETGGMYIQRNNNLTLNSLHTQSNTKDFTATKYMLDDDDTAEKIVLSPVGGCIVRLNDGTNNLRHNAIGDTLLVGSTGTMSYGYASTVFNRTGTDDASVTATAYNEYNELVVNNVNEAENPFSVTVTSNYAYKETGNKVTAGILCPNVNGGSDSNTSATTATPIELTFTYTNLPSTFTSFNSIGLDIHALNGSGNYQYNNDTKARQWNIAVSVSTDGGGTFTDFGSVSDIDIAAGIGVSQESVHKVWNIVKSDEAQDFAINGSLVVKLTIQKGTTNQGCFFGLSNVILSAEGDTWYIEEMPDAEKQYIYHETGTTQTGLGSVMLGFSAKIPAGIAAYYPRTVQDYTDKHITFQSYGEVSDPVRLLPACTPAILKTDDATASYRFYYDGSEVAEAANKANPEDDDIIIDGSLYQMYQPTEYYNDKFGADCNDCNIYMYLSNKTLPKLYWVYENYRADGSKTGNNDDGGHINVNANRAFIVIGKNVAKSISSFSLRLDNTPTTGIEDYYDDYVHVVPASAAKGIFDLQGRKLSEATAPGIYIIDGEKVLVK